MSIEKSKIRIYKKSLYYILYAAGSIPYLFIQGAFENIYACESESNPYENKTNKQHPILYYPILSYRIDSSLGHVGNQSKGNHPYSNGCNSGLVQ